MVDSMIDEYQKIVHLGQRVSAEVFCSRVLNKKTSTSLHFSRKKSTQIPEEEKISYFTS